MAKDALILKKMASNHSISWKFYRGKRNLAKE